MADTPHTHCWTLAWFGFHVQETCACGAIRTTTYDGDGEWDVQEPRAWEIGVTAITAPHDPRWTGETVQALNENAAALAAEQRGFYRNLVVRPV